MRRPSHLAAVVVALALPAPASAAYAPELSVKIDPATPSSPPAVTSTVTQAAGETASKTVKVSFPAGFTAPSSPVTVGTCSSDQEAQRACPADSQIGRAAATASVLGLPVDLTGTVHYGGVVENRIKLIVFLDNAALGQHVTVEGFVSIRPSDGGFDTVFDNLPNTLTTSFTLALDGAPRSLVTNPSRCGDYAFAGTFTSQKGESATSSSTVTIAGCRPPALVMSPLDVTGSTLTFALSEPAAVTVTVKHGGRLVARRSLAGHKGDNRVRHLTRGLRPGRYAVRVSARTADGRATARRATVRVARHARG